MERQPKGYVGLHHEVLGSDILSILEVLKFPEQVLGDELTRSLRKLEPDQWYPVATLLNLLDVVDERVGTYGLLSMGRALFKLSHEEQVKKTILSARECVYGIHDMYMHANRGTKIGGWKVLRFEPGYAELEKTTPHHCMLEQGIVAAALQAVGCPSRVDQKACFRRGADSCLFTISSSITGPQWTGRPDESP